MPCGLGICEYTVHHLIRQGGSGSTWLLGPMTDQVCGPCPSRIQPLNWDMESHLGALQYKQSSTVGH